MTLTFDLAVNPLIGLAVFASTAVTDAAYVFFNAAVVARHRVRAANWSAVWYLLSAFAVISYTENPVYVAFARGWLMDRGLCFGDVARPHSAGSDAPQPALIALASVPG